MTTARCGEWLNLCAGIALQNLQLAGHAPESPVTRFEDEFITDPLKAAALGFLLQWACEDNESYAATFRSIAHGEQALCPFHDDGIGFAVNLVRNGIMDDWEIYAHWGQGGYVIVPEWQRQDADRRFDFDWASDWLLMMVDALRCSNLVEDIGSESVIAPEAEQVRTGDAEALSGMRPRQS